LTPHHQCELTDREVSSIKLLDRMRVELSLQLQIHVFELVLTITIHEVFADKNVVRPARFAYLLGTNLHDVLSERITRLCVHKREVIVFTGFTRVKRTCRSTNEPNARSIEAIQ